mgnify:CR=1 FL=1
MGAYITPEGVTEYMADRLSSEYGQCAGGFTYSTVNTTILEANDGGAAIPLADGINTYDGRHTPTYEDVAALYEAAAAVEARAGPDFHVGLGGPRLLANAFRGAWLPVSYTHPALPTAPCGCTHSGAGATTRRSQTAS